jgi:hypothetical protein
VTSSPEQIGQQPGSKAADEKNLLGCRDARRSFVLGRPRRWRATMRMKIAMTHVTLDGAMPSFGAAL